MRPAMTSGDGKPPAVTIPRRVLTDQDRIVADVAPAPRRPDQVSTAPRFVPAHARAPRVAALRRPRLLEVMSGLWTGQVAVVVAPAGAGKTTLLSQFAATTAGPVVWHRTRRRDACATTMLRRLGHDCAEVLGVTADWEDVDAAVEALERYQGPPALVVIDDLHVLTGTDAVAALSRFVAVLPATVRLLLASRHVPDVNLGPPRLAGALLELRAEDLRFRSWEIDQLFREHYREPLRPEDVALLGRHTEGWAAGLALFHLATTGKPATQRRTVLTSLRPRARLVREYLSKNVLDELPSDVRAFLMETSVLGVLSGPLCDEFLGRAGSAEVLDLLERRQVFIEAADDGETFRYHEVLRSSLESALVDRLTHQEVRERYRRAGSLLERTGAPSEALRAYVRAEEWVDVERVLGQSGEQLARDAGSWLDVLPATLLDEDPWLLLAKARRHCAAGRLEAALAAYRLAEARLVGRYANSCQAERFSVAVWTEPVPRPGSGWLIQLRQATYRDPLAVARATDPAPRGAALLVAGVAGLLAGDLTTARPLLCAVAADTETSPLVSLCGLLASSVLEHLAGHEPAPATWEHLAVVAERARSPWLARLARAASALCGDDAAIEAAAAMSAQCQADGDAWGSALAHLFHGMGTLSGREPDPAPLDRAADEFRLLGGSVLEAWARAYLAQALAALDDPRAAPAAASAESTARAAGVTGARAIAFRALSDTDPGRRDMARNAVVLAAECGLPLPSRAVPASAPVRVHCFGRLDVRRGDESVDLTALRPRARGVLQVLAANAGRAVHWEVVAAAIWPDADQKTAARNLHVAVSSIRQVLEPTAAPRRSTTLIRRGEAYQLVVGWLDVRDFEDLLTQAHHDRAVGNDIAAAGSLRRALDLYTADLLPEAGPAEWAVERRDRLRSAAADAAHTLAELHLAAAHPVEAEAAARRGLRLDPYRDRLWQLLFDVLGRDSMALAHCREQYAAALGELTTD